MIDIKYYFNKNRRDHYWKPNKEKYKRFFRRKLMELKIAIDLNTSEADLKLDTYRALGYMGIGTQSGLSLGIKSEDTIRTKKKLADHVIGTVQIGTFIHSECEKYNWDFDYMVDTWLYENLWIWATIFVSKEEHKNENIRINADTIEDKRFLRHYLNVSDFYESKLNGKKLVFD